MKIDHIGYLCKNMQNSLEEFQNLGYQKQSEIYQDTLPLEDGQSRNVFICFLEKDGYRIELVTPINKDSVVYDTLKKRGEGPYHICYQVKNLEAELEQMVEQGYFVIQEPNKAIAFQNSRVAFLFKMGVGIIELVERGFDYVI